MDFILPFPLKQAEKQISIKHDLLLMGSCFAEEIGKKLEERKFKAITNPHGISYNPTSLSNAITDYLENKVYVKEDLFHHNELWQSFNHHGKFSSTDSTTCLKEINAEVNRAHTHLKNTKWLIITFGSAFAYVNKKTNVIVANCHKIPSVEFEKVLLSKNQIIAVWNKQLGALKKFNPDLNILFTVSPVRYVRDGLVENNRSKGILLDAVHTLIEQNTNCFYFPAYEIVIDELRDYRFYKEDLVHPNEMAVNYVWEKFVSTLCNEETKKFLAEYEPLLKSIHHRPLQEDTEAYIKFKLQLEEKIKNLEKKFFF
jgi:hypothetical protein